MGSNLCTSTKERKRTVTHEPKLSLDNKYKQAFVPTPAPSLRVSLAIQKTSYEVSPPPNPTSILDQASPPHPTSIHDQASPPKHTSIHDQASPPKHTSIHDQASPPKHTSIFDQPSPPKQTSIFDQPSPQLLPQRYQTSIFDQPSTPKQNTILDQPSPQLLPRRYQTSIFDQPSTPKQNTILDQPSPPKQTSISKQQSHLKFMKYLQDCQKLRSINKPLTPPKSISCMRERNSERPFLSGLIPKTSSIPTKQQSQRETNKNSVSKGFSLTFDTSLKSLIDGGSITKIYVLSHTRLIIYIENSSSLLNSISVVSFDNETQKWQIDFEKSVDDKIIDFCKIDDNRLLTLKTKVIDIWTIHRNDLEFIKTLNGPFCNVSCLVYLGKLSLIASASKNEKIMKIWRCEHPYKVYVTIKPKEFINLLYKVKHGHKLLGSSASSIYIWSSRNFEYLGEISSICLERSKFVELPNGHLAVFNVSRIKIINLNKTNKYGNSNNHIIQVIKEEEYITGDKYLNRVGSLFLFDEKSFIYSGYGVLMRIIIRDNQKYKIKERIIKNSLKFGMHVDYKYKYIIFKDKTVAYYGPHREKICNNVKVDLPEEDKNLYPSIKNIINID